MCAATHHSHPPIELPSVKKKKKHTKKPDNLPKCLTPMFFSQYIWVSGEQEKRTCLLVGPLKSVFFFHLGFTWVTSFSVFTGTYVLRYDLILRSYSSTHTLLRLSGPSRPDRSSFSSDTHLESSTSSLLKFISISYTYMYFPHATVSFLEGRSIIFLLFVPWLLS